MNDLYKESLIEAKKLKEIAEEKAKSDLMEALAPYIKKTINEEISDVSENFFFEEEEPMSETEQTEQTVQDPTGIVSQGQELGDETNTAPINVGNDLGATGMPDDQGLLTVGVQDLFSQEDDDQTEQTVDQNAAPIATPQKDTDTLYEFFNKKLLETVEKIDYLYFSEKVTDFQKESVKERLFSLLENLDSMKNKGLLSEKQIKINEHKLEFLFQKLKEAGNSNSYLKKNQKEDNIMTTLKEYTARLFAEDVDPKTNQPSTADDKHAAEQSGVSPEVGGPEDVKVAAENDLYEETNAGAAGSVNADALPGAKKSGKEEHWAEGDATLDEKDQDKVVSEALDALSEEVESEGKAGYGKNDTAEQTPVEFEIDEAELCEAIEALRKEGIKDKMSSIKETTDSSNKDSWEDAEPEGGNDPSQKVLDNTNKPEQTELDVVKENDELAGLDDLDVDGVSDDAVSDAGDAEVPDADIVLNIELPDEVEDALANVDPAQVDVDVELGDVDLDGADEMGSEVPVEEPMDDLEAPVEEPAPEEEEETQMALQESVLKEMAVKDAKLKKAARALKEQKQKIASLQSELKESNLFVAKNVFFTKCLQRGDISKENLKKIVEHLDRAKTVKEAKEIYGKIKNSLNEAVAASNKLAGSSSKVTKPGSAVSLQESKQPEQGGLDLDRWQRLAGIKKSDD